MKLKKVIKPRNVKELKKVKWMILFAAVLTALSQLASLGAEGFPGAASAAVEAAFDVDRLQTDPTAEVLLVVRTNAEPQNATGELFLYTRSPQPDGRMSGWKEVLAGIPAKLGRGGTGKAREGDSKTPLGLYSMNTPFGIGARLEGFPENYLVLDENYYWDGDCSSPTYNLLVDRRKTTAFNPFNSEHLCEVVPQYEYCLNIGYNADCVKGAGSALFLHCLGEKKENTGGCIAIDRGSMQTVLRTYKEKKTQILIADKGTFGKYCR